MTKLLTRFLAVLTLVAGVAMFGPTSTVRLAAAPPPLDVTLPAGAYNFNALATTDADADPATFTVTGNFTMQTGAIIECNDTGNQTSACPITIVVGGNMVMAAGSAITANQQVFGGGNAGNITITVAGNMTMCGPNGGQAGCAAGAGGSGALISATRSDSNAPTSIKTVKITVGDKNTATGNFYMEGGITTYGAETGAKIVTDSRAGKSGTIEITAGKTYFTEPGSVIQSGRQVGTTLIGGKIYIVADCGLTTEGRITSKGPDPGADLVHLESCSVIIRGLVESTGVGHGLGAANNCDNINDGLPGEVLRVHDAKATGCIEVWGKVITIDSSSGWAGELNADIGNTGGGEGTSWIDIFAYGNLTVIDDTGNDFVRSNGASDYLSTYAVHANTLVGTSDKTPGLVTAKVKSGPLTASGKAFEASSTMTGGVGAGGLSSNTGHFPGPYFMGNGSDGGTVYLEASGAVTLDGAWVNATGDFAGGPPCPINVSGACGAGGHIIVNAWGAASPLSWLTGSGDVRTNDDSADPPPPDILGGTIVLNAGGTITTGADFHSEVPTETHAPEAAKPSIPDITADNGGPVFKTDLWLICGGSTISGIKFHDLNANGVNNGEPGLGGWVIHLYGTDVNSNPVHLTQTTTAVSGAYTFTGVPAGTYTVCEQLQVTSPAWQQTFPTSGATCTTAADPDNLTPGLRGYLVDLTTGTCCEGQEITGKDFGNIQLARKTGMKWEDVNGNHVKDPGDNGWNGWVIHLFGTAVNGSAVHQTYTTAGGGLYTFTVLPGSYTVCEQLQGTAVQTFPQAGAGIVSCVGLDGGDNPTPGPLGYAIVLGSGDVDSGNDFGNDPHTSLTCQKPTAIAIMNEAFPLNAGPDVTVKTWLGESVQTAVDNATDLNGDHYVILMVIAKADGSLGGTANQKVAISKDYTLVPASNYPFGLIGCSVTMTGGGSGPAVWIKDTAKGKQTTINGRSANILVADLHGGNSAVGVQADGTLRYLRNEYGTSNGVGIKVLGGNNTVHNGSATGNTGDGVYVSGNSNYMTDTKSMSNGGNGFNIAGNTNQLLKLGAGEKGTPNTLDGVHVVGNTNTLSEIDAFNNGCDGIDVAGTGNILNKNTAGEKAKGNKDTGIRVAGASNSLTENKASTNTKDGFNVSGGTTSATANILKSNVSNTGSSGSVDYENGGAEYRLLGYIKSLGGNKLDNTSIPSAAKFPAFPATNATVNFTAVTGIGE